MLAGSADRRDVAAVVDLARCAVILQRGRCAQRRVIAVPQCDVVRAHQAFHGIGQVLRLQISKLALLCATSISNRL